MNKIKRWLAGPLFLLAIFILCSFLLNQLSDLDPAPPSEKFSSPKTLIYFLFILVIPLVHLFGYWVVMMSTPWSRLANNYAHDCDISKMFSIDSQVSIGGIPAQLLPGKLFFRETPAGIELAIDGLFRHFGFNDLLVPWTAFESAIDDGASIVLSVKDSSAQIKLPAKELKEAPKYLSINEAKKD